MVAQDGIVGSAAVARWTEVLEEMHGRIAHRFARSEARDLAKRYLHGLFGRAERKNGWQSPRPSGSPTRRASSAY